MTDPKPKTLLEALHAVQAEIPSLHLGKDAAGQVAGNRRYKYLSLDKLMGEVLPLLNKHGLVWSTMPGGTASEPRLVYELAHVSGGTSTGSMPLMLDKPTSQMLGSALTYARRYALTAVLGIVPDEDDDGAKASEAPTIEKAAVQAGGLMSGAQLQNMWRALAESPISDERKEMILAAEGVTPKSTDVTLEQGRAIRKRLDEAT